MTKLVEVNIDDEPQPASNGDEVTADGGKNLKESRESLALLMLPLLIITVIPPIIRESPNSRIS